MLAYIIYILVGLAVLGVLGVVLLLARLINGAVVQSIELIEAADPFLEPVENGGAVLAEGADYASRMSWATAHGFEPDIMADVNATADGSTMVVALWKNPGTHTWFASYDTDGKVHSELVTTLSQESGLTTSNSIDSSLFPQRPGHYVQVFGDADFDTLLRRHEEGLLHLRNAKHLEVQDHRKSTTELVTDSVNRTMAHIQSIPFWKHKGAYWYFFRRPRMNNKPIAELYP